jgi:phosphopantothenoylcysteine decarboxylase
MNIVIGVTGSISAYKAADITSQLKKLGHEVYVVMTKSATEFITPLTLQVLSKNVVHLDVIAEPDVRKVNHIELALLADVFVLAPATANIAGKIANGIADDLLSTIAMALPKGTKRMIAPAMNTRMYDNPIHQRNLAILKNELGYIEIEPKTAMLACGDVGRGALADVADIVGAIDDYVSK